MTTARRPESETVLLDTAVRGRAVTDGAAQGDGDAAERLYRRAIARNERNVHGTGARRPFLDPQVSAPVGDEAERPLRAFARL